MFVFYVFQSTLVTSQSVMFLSFHKDYPFTPERVQIDENILSDYQCCLLQDEGFSKPPPKLLPNLRNKRNYIFHFRNLKLYLEWALPLINGHHVFLFNQSPWFKNYINFNIRQCTTAKNSFGKQFFKMMNIAVFGQSFIFLGFFVLIY